jgi:hypothetical protein
MFMQPSYNHVLQPIHPILNNVSIMHQFLVISFNQLTIGWLLNIVCMVENAGMKY